MIRRPPKSTLVRSSAASDVYKLQVNTDAAELASNVSSNELEFGEVYDFSEVAQILNETEISPTETGGVGTSSAITESNAFVIVGLFSILILSCGILIYLRRKQL